MKDITEKGYRFMHSPTQNVLRSVYGDVVWPLPRGRIPGAWVVHDRPCELCKSGLHASPNVLFALQERQGQVLCVVEARNVDERGATKYSARKMRIVRVCSRKQLVALAGLMAASVLRIFERAHPTDSRPRHAIDLVCAWLRGENSDSFSVSAACAACAAAAAACAAAAVAAAHAAVAAHAAADAVVADAHAARAAFASAAAADAAVAISAADAGVANANRDWRAWCNRIAARMLSLPERRLADVIKTEMRVRHRGSSHLGETK